MGAAFSEGGDTIFLVGQDHAATMGGAGLLATIRASDGTRLTLDTTSYAPCGVDRKSTRLNSSHGYISYAVFCLKKKRNNVEHIINSKNNNYTFSHKSRHKLIYSAMTIDHSNLH